MLDNLHTRAYSLNGSFSKRLVTDMAQLIVFFVFDIKPIDNFIFTAVWITSLRGNNAKRRVSIQAWAGRLYTGLTVKRSDVPAD